MVVRVNNLVKMLAVLSIVIAVFLIVALIFNARRGSISGGAIIEMVSSTEYTSGEYGQVIVRLVGEDGKGITTADCRLNILFPDNKRYLFVDVPLQPSTESGNYFMEFVVPNSTGTYSELIKCNYKDGKEEGIKVISSSFHVSTALNLILEISQKMEERYAGLQDTILSENKRMNELIIQQFSASLNESRSQQEFTRSLVVGLLGENKQLLNGVQENISAEIALIRHDVDSRVNDVEGKLNRFGEAIGWIFSNTGDNS